MLIIPDLFTPWIEGTELARKANWDDLQKYNTVQKGQLDNLEALATFSPRVNREFEITDKHALNNRSLERQDILEEAAMPGRFAQESALSQARTSVAPQYANDRATGELAALNAALSRYGYDTRAYDWAANNVGIPRDKYGNPVPGGATTPSLTGSPQQTMPSVPSIPNFKPGGQPTQPSTTAPTSTQKPTAATVPTQQQPEYRGLPRRTPTIDANQALSPEQRAAYDSEQRDINAYNARVEQLYRDYGITPSTRSSYALPNLNPTMVDGKWQYRATDNLTPFSNEDYYNNLLGLPVSSYATRQPYERDPLQADSFATIDDLANIGVTQDVLDGITPGNMVIAGNNIVLRTQEGQYRMFPINAEMGNATTQFLIDTGAAQQQGKK